MDWLLDLLAEVLTEAVSARRERRRERRRGAGISPGAVPVQQSSSRHDVDVDTYDHRGRRL